MKRGQSAVEFVLLTSLMFLLFGVTIIGVQKALLDTTVSAKQRTVYEVQQAVVKELVLAESMPPGYERTFRLPADIQGYGYTLTVNTETEPLKDELVVSLLGESAVYYLDQNVSGTLQPGGNTLARNAGVIRLN